MLVKVAFVIKSTMLTQVVERSRLYYNEPRSSPANSSGRKCSVNLYRRPKLQPDTCLVANYYDYYYGNNLIQNDCAKIQELDRSIQRAEVDLPGSDIF